MTQPPFNPPPGWRFRERVEVESALVSVPSRLIAELKELAETYDAGSLTNESSQGADCGVIWIIPTERYSMTRKTIFPRRCPLSPYSCA